MSIRIPASEFHQFTGSPNDRATELLVDMYDETVTLKAGSTMLHLTREQVEQLNQCFRDWLDGNHGEKWSDFWTLALK